MTKKLCIDCMHCRLAKIGDAEFYKCTRPTGISLVNGKPDVPRYEFCSTQRDADWLGARVTGTCGKSGRFWEPKPDEPARRIDGSIDEYVS